MKRESIYESDLIDADWLPEHNMLYITYKGELVYESTQRAYQIGGQVLIERGGDSFEGIIGDFRQVTGFPNTNISTVQKNSKQANKQHDMSAFGVALLVENMMQETFVKVTMEVTNTSYHSRIVHSLDEAFEFLQDYRAKHAQPQHNASDEKNK